MKKKMCILLVLALSLASLTACGKKTSADIKPIEPKPSETVQTPTDESNDETKPSEPEETKPEENFEPGDIIEIVPSDRVASGEFGTNADFTGIYEITGYASVSFGSHGSLSLTLKGVDNGNSGDYDASNTAIPNYITDFSEYVYLKLVFGADGLEDWGLIDKMECRDLKQATESQLNDYLFPETKYEQVSVGALPDEILLSNYAPGKMYVFDIVKNEDGSYSLPDIINDTDITVLAVSTRISENEEFKREMKVNKVIESNAMHFSFGSDYAEKVYMAVMESSANYLVRTADCLALSECEVGSMIDFDFEDFVYNDTDKTITLHSEDNGNDYVLKPGEVVECSWMNDILVVKAE